MTNTLQQICAEGRQARERFQSRGPYPYSDPHAMRQFDAYWEEDTLDFRTRFQEWLTDLADAVKSDREGSASFLANFVPVHLPAEVNSYFSATVAYWPSCAVDKSIHSPEPDLAHRGAARCHDVEVRMDLFTGAPDAPAQTVSRTHIEGKRSFGRLRRALQDESNFRLMHERFAHQDAALTVVTPVLVPKLDALPPDDVLARVLAYLEAVSRMPADEQADACWFEVVAAAPDTLTPAATARVMTCQCLLATLAEHGEALRQSQEGSCERPAPTKALALHRSH